MKVVIDTSYLARGPSGTAVYVEQLVRALRGLSDLDVRVQAFGAARHEPGVTAYADLPELGAANAALQTMGVDLAIASGCEGTRPSEGEALPLRLNHCGYFLDDSLDLELGHHRALP